MWILLVVAVVAIAVVTSAQLAAVVAVLIAVWGVSSVLHPYTKCRLCQGTARHRATMRPWAYRPCHRCSGTGQQRTLGAVVFQRGKRRVSRSRIEPKTDKNQ